MWFDVIWKHYKKRQNAKKSPTIHLYKKIRLNSDAVVKVYPDEIHVGAPWPHHHVGENGCALPSANRKSVQIRNSFLFKINQFDSDKNTHTNSFVSFVMIVYTKQNKIIILCSNFGIEKQNKKKNRKYIDITRSRFYATIISFIHLRLHRSKSSHYTNSA